MDWFSAMLNTGIILTMGLLQLSFLGRFTKKPPAPWHYFVYLLLLYTSDRVATAWDGKWLGIASALLVTYWMARLVLGNKRLTAWTATILAVYVPQLAFGILNPLQMLLFPLAVGRPLLWVLVVLATLLALGGSLVCYGLILKWFSLGEGPSVWLLLTPGLFLFAAEIYLLDTAYGQVTSVPSPAGPQLLLLGLQLLALGALFTTLHAYRRTCDGLAAQAVLASLTQETRAQRTYVAQAQLRYERTRAFRHDMKNHLSVVEGLLKRGDESQALAYLQKLGTAAEALSFPVSTGNPVVDILLGDKLGLAQADGVQVAVSLALPRPSAQVADLDLCVIFANALDNALRACQQVEGQAFLRVTGARQGDFYMLEFENSCPPAPPWGMGTGLSNVRAVAERYGGVITVEQRPDRFRLNVLLNISGQETDRLAQGSCIPGEKNYNGAI